jgi:hypothetical protein
MTEPIVDNFDREGIPDSKTWERYRDIIGGLKWEWKAAANQQEGIDPAQEMGDYIFHVSRTTDTGAFILPEGASLDSIVKVLEWLTTDDPKRPNKPQKLNIESEAGATVIVHCKRSDIASQFGFSMDKNKSEKPTAALALKLELPNNPLYDAVFYRSGDNSNKLYCFIPQPVKPLDVRHALKEKTISLAEGPKLMMIGNRSGTRIEIDKKKSPGAAEILNAMGISIFENSNSAQRELENMEKTNQHGASIA